MERELVGGQEDATELEDVLIWDPLIGLFLVVRLPAPPLCPRAPEDQVGIYIKIGIPVVHSIDVRPHPLSPSDPSLRQVCRRV